MLIKLKPNTPGQRGTVLVSKKHLSSEAPYKSLTKPIKSSGGRNNQGRITSRRIGGRVKRKYREIDFKRNKFNISAEVIRNEYDPNRSSFISLVKYEDGEYKYILSPRSLNVGDKIIMVGDPFLNFTKAIGAEVDKSGRGLGIRSNRYTMLVDDMKVIKLQEEKDTGSCEISAAENFLKLI